MTEYFVDPHAICDSRSIGAGTRIWEFARVLAGAVIGKDCNLCSHTFVEDDVVIGDRVTIKCGVQLWDGVRLEDDVFIGPNATFTNDRFPRSRVYPERFLETVVRKRASIGANATILPGITIGQNALVGAGAVVTRSVPPHAIVVGNPARIVGYVDSHRVRPDRRQPELRDTPGESSEGEQVQNTAVPGVTLHRFPLIEDMRGNLTVGEFEKDLPFLPKRYFMVFDVPNREIRGEHAHRACHLFLVCVKGSCSLVADDGTNREEVLLDHPTIGVHLPPMIWGTQYRYSPDAVLLVFASEIYDAEDYIRDYQEFVETKGRHRTGNQA